MKKLLSISLGLFVAFGLLFAATPVSYAHHGGHGGCGNGGGHYGYHNGGGCPYNNSQDCPYYN